MGHRIGRGRWGLIYAIMVIMALITGGAEAKDKRRDSEAGANVSHAVELDGLNGLAHACAISPHVLLTARHVALHFTKDDPLGLHDDVGTTLVSKAEGTWGLAHYYTDDSLQSVDIALMVNNVEAVPYPLAVAPPEEGEILYVADYSHDTKDFFHARRRTWKVVNVLPGHIMLQAEHRGDATGFPGISGSCLLRHRDTGEDEIVGVFTGGLTVDNESYNDQISVGIAVAIWRPLATYLKTAAGEAEQALVAKAAVKATP